MMTNYVNIHTPSIQMLSPNTISHFKESNLLGEMPDLEIHMMSLGCLIQIWRLSKTTRVVPKSPEKVFHWSRCNNLHISKNNKCGILKYQYV